MTGAEISYAQFCTALKAALPELRIQLEQEFRDASSETPYAVVVLVLKPFLRKLLDHPSDTSPLRKIFDFFEDMAKSSDVEVVNLLQVAVFESLVREPKRLAAAWCFMGEATKAIARSTAQTWHFEHNLPTK
jgi:phage FluMu gp28-like protein